jgi:SAM-dependent methyltransferase
MWWLLRAQHATTTTKTTFRISPKYCRFSVFPDEVPMLKDTQDAFGRMLVDYYYTQSGVEIIEREDGFISTGAGPVVYFLPFEEWPEHYKTALDYAQGRCLDIGCGAGRLGLHLQSQGMPVLGIDVSPLALEVCRLRGYAKTALLSITQISKKLGQFDTVCMFGNNFGLFANPQRARHLLKRLHAMTSSHARLLAESNYVYQTDDPVHLAYHAWNRQRGRMSGQLRIRSRYRKMIGAWFDYLIVSKPEMEQILDGTGWRVVRYLDRPDRPMIYLAVIEKI